MMSYFKTRLRSLRSEYTASDRAQRIRAAGSKCSLCGRKHGDEAVFGPTAYLKKRIRFKVYIDIHVIEGGPLREKNVVMCAFCHLSYHLYNRLAEDAVFGSSQLKKTVYRRCRRCGEMSCRCCSRCHRAPKWCLCGEKKTSKKRKRVARKQ